MYADEAARQDTAVQELAKFAIDEAGDLPIPFPLFGEEGFDVSSDGPLTHRISIPGKSVLGQVNSNRLRWISNLRV